MADFIPYGRQAISEDDIQAVVDVLRSDWLTTGPAIQALEDDFAAAVETPHALSCSSATAALHLALAGLGVGPGDVCIVPAITFLATANAAIYCGAEIEFCDVCPETGLMTADSLKSALQRRGGKAAAVLPVHLAGQSVDMTAITPIARAAGAVVVEDACHAVGSYFEGRPVGACTLSDAATFSFHPVKTLAAGEGGMVTTRNAELAHAVSRMRSHGVERAPEFLERGFDEPWWYEMQSIGWNYRLTDMQAALARSQLRRLGEFRSARQALARAYDDALATVSEHIQPLERVDNCEPCLHLYPVSIDFNALGKGRSEVMQGLRERQIGSQVHYIPLYKQPFFRQRYGEMTLPGAEAYYARTLSLPLYASMSEDVPKRVVSNLVEVLGL